MAAPAAETAAATGWQPFRPGRHGAFDRRRAAHLLRRTGFGASPDDVDLAVESGLEDALAFCLRDPGPPDRVAGALARALAGRFDSEPLRGIQARWLARMIEAPHPLTERMTLFWHDHFATSQRKVRDPVLMERQNLTLRALGLTTAEELLTAICRDPAMLVFLDGGSNSKRHPNENFARELFELFTLGRGHYTEADVQEAARALSGFRLSGREARFVPAEHDASEKTIFSRTGRYGPEQVVTLALEHPEASRYLARRLFEAFVHDAPDDAVIAPLAAKLRTTGYSIQAAVGMIVRSTLFFSDRAIGRKVRSPVEYALSAILALSVRYDPARLAADLEEMGMSLYQPPDVSGWKGGAAWINATTLGARYRFAERLTSRGSDRLTKERWDPLGALAARGLTRPAAIVDHYLQLLLARTVDRETRAQLVSHARKGPGGFEARVRGLVRMILTLPEAHLG